MLPFHYPPLHRVIWVGEQVPPPSPRAVYKSPEELKRDCACAEPKCSEINAPRADMGQLLFAGLEVNSRPTASMYNTEYLWLMRSLIYCGTVDFDSDFRTYSHVFLV